MTQQNQNDIVLNLESALDDERLNGIQLAIRFPEPRVVAALTGVATHDENGELRYRARQAIQAIANNLVVELSPMVGGAQGAEAIQAGLTHADPSVRARAAKALALVALPNREAIFKDFLAREQQAPVRVAAIQSSSAMSKAGLGVMVFGLGDPDSAVKASAVEAIDAVKDPDGYMHIVPFLSDTDARVRQMVAAALNKIGKETLIKILERMVASEKVAWRDAAVYAIGMARLPEGLPLLEKALSDAADAVRLKAVRALEVLAPQVPGAKAALARYRAMGGEGEATVEVAVGDLFNRDEGLKATSSADILNDGSPEVRVSELKNIMRLKAYERIDEVVRILRKEKDENVRATVLRTLGVLRARKYISVIKSYLKDSNHRVRANAVEALGSFEDPTLWVELIPFLDDTNNRVSSNAIIALKSCSDVDLEPYIRKLLTNPNLNHKKSALYTLLELREDRYLGLYLIALDDPSDEIRQRALEDIVILRSEGIAKAEELYREAVSRGLRPPDDTAAIQARSGRTAQETGIHKVITISKEIDKLLIKIVEAGASDLHLSSDHIPHMRKDGDIQILDGFSKYTNEQVKSILWPIMSERHRKEYDALKDTDFAYSIERISRFRVNVFQDMYGIGAVFRQLPSKIPSVDKLGLSKEVTDLCFLPKGLILVTGPTGSGKSTTLAALVAHINNLRSDHIITIEDPIEFVHKSKKCLVNQREVHKDTMSFKAALRAALREDPDIVLVGELRDLETSQIAIETAETGHLVFGTLHTNTASSTVDRLINQFPKEIQEHIRLMVSESLKAVIAQTLAKKIGGGRVAVQEIMIVNSAIANLIREEKTFQIPSIIQTSRHLGNVLLNDSLFDLVKRGLVEVREAYFKSIDKIGFADRAKTMGIQLDFDMDEVEREKKARQLVKRPAMTG